MGELDRIRTDVVGSLLRPDAWKEARLAFETGKMPAAEFTGVELDCIKRHLALQESIGLDVVTDGEISRLNFQDSFGLAVSGYDAGAETVGSQERRAGSTPLARWDIPDLAAPGTPVVHRRPVVRRLQLERNVPLEEYRRAAPIAGRPVKVSLIGPDRIMQRYDHAASTAVYPTVDAFLADVVAIQRRMIGELVAAGCRYVHIDEPGYTAYVDEPSLAAMRERGEDPMENFGRSLRANAELARGFPGVTFGLHLCRG
ncbi:MAG TPA: hypothetical protein VE756_00570, partial [Burkholderiales bacterium]|nr:hypothetical protein [Burkholderiales bacterium]